MSSEIPGEYDMAALMQEAIECLPTGFCIMDSAFRPILANQIMREALGATFSAMEPGGSHESANSVSETWPETSNGEYWDTARQILQSTATGQAMHLTTRDGRVFNAICRVMSGGRYVAVCIEITQLKQRENELKALKRSAEAANQAKSAFLANMSHEIRTPLNGVLGMAEALARSELSPEYSEQVGVILESGKAFKAVMDDVIDLSRIETGRMELTLSDKNLLKVLTCQYELWLPRAEAKGVDLRLHVAADVPAELNFDPVRFGQCLSNLVSNAIKFTERGHVMIEVASHRLAEGIKISVAVTDTGIGMSLETAVRLFVPFTQADNSISRRFGGTGLGLVITQKLAKLMGGDVVLQSAEDEGSTFTVSMLAQPPLGPLERAASNGQSTAEANTEVIPSPPIEAEAPVSAAAELAEPITSYEDLTALLAAMDREIAPAEARKKPLSTDSPAKNLPEGRPAAKTPMDHVELLPPPNEYDLAMLTLEAIDCLPDGFAIVDSELRPIIANQLLRDIYDAFYTAADRGLTYRESSFASRKNAHPGMSDDECWREVDKIQAKVLSGDAFPLATTGGRTFSSIFRPMRHGRYVAVSVDITDHLAREEDLERSRHLAEAANLAKSAFLANMSHEVRTPLNGILGMAQILAQGRMTSAQLEQVEQILASGKELKAILDDVLDLSQIEAGSMELVFADKNLHDLLRLQERLWLPHAEQKGIGLRLDIDDAVPDWLRFDPVHLSQCISNLLSNAVKFTERGKIAVSVSAMPNSKGTAIALRISDTGIGMSADMVAKLFQPFIQAEDSISRRVGGTGLGLVITRKLARLMGGDVTATSMEGKGSTFKLTFIAEPAQTESGPSAAASGPKAPKRRAKHVLLVDDNALNRRVAKLFLKPGGYCITEAENGLEALKRLAEDSFDIVLLDIHMPVLDGLATLKRMRASSEPWNAIPVIALTADAMSGDRERYLAEGMDGYISKPIDQRELLAEIARLLRAPLSQVGG